MILKVILTVKKCRKMHRMTQFKSVQFETMELKLGFEYSLYNAVARLKYSK